MHCAAPPVSLLWCVWNYDLRGDRLESTWHWRGAIPVAHVSVEVVHCLWDSKSQPVVIVVLIVVCN